MARPAPHRAVRASGGSLLSRPGRWPWLAVLVALLSLAVAGPALGQNRDAESDPTAGARQVRTAIVLDASNSMFGTVGRVAKISILERAVGRGVLSMPAQADAGVVVFGHRRAADCSDVEALVPVGPVDPSRIVAAIRSVEPRGESPLTDAMAVAARQVDFRAGRTTLLVVADGGDGCDRDPCAMAERLEGAGADLTIHVVGFDLRRDEDREQLSCVASRTGGVFREADDEASLTEAVIALINGPPVATLRPVPRLGSASLIGKVRWTIRERSTDTVVLRDHEAGVLPLALPPGSYDVRAIGNGQVGEARFQMTGRDLALDVVMETVVSLRPPPGALVGSSFAVDWIGPNGPGDYLTLSAPGSPVTSFESYARTSGGQGLTLTAPPVPGTYEIRYVDAAAGQILATATLPVRPPDIEIAAPAEAEASSLISVLWEGPGEPGDRMVVVEPTAPVDAGIPVGLIPGAPAELRLPALSGEYEIRYINNSGGILARRPIAVIVPVLLEARPVAVAGSRVEVRWTGPNAAEDSITIVRADAPDSARGAFTYVRVGNPLTVAAEGLPGPSEVRYISGASGAVLGRLPITLTLPDIVLDAPIQATAGSTIRVDWQGPATREDLVTVVPADAPDDTVLSPVFTYVGNPLDVITPTEAGPAEIRFINSETGVVLARRAVALTAAVVTLGAPDTAVAGSQVPVFWEGPDGRNDAITIVPVGTPDDQTLNYNFTRRGSPLEVLAPPDPGIVEIRYRAGQDGRVLARRQMVLTAPEIAIEAPPEAVAGAAVEIVWRGPDNPNDFITVVMADAPDNAREHYSFTRNGSPLAVVVPQRTGEAEIRYRSGQTGDVLGRRAVLLTRAAVTLDAPPSAVAGATVPVRWTGPGGRSDFITIVSAGVPDEQREAFNYVRRGNPLEVLAPGVAGAAEIRYVAGEDNAVLGRLALQLVEPTVSLTAVEEATAGATIEVRWAGPANDGDFVTIVPGGAEDRARGDFAYATGEEETVRLMTPAEPGPAEIRYRAGGTGDVLERRALLLIEPDITLQARPIAPAGGSIPVFWDGPDNEGDFITVVPVGTPEDRRGEYNFTRRGNPLPINLPPIRGRAEVRYMSGQTGKTLARIQIELR
ncbi:MAG: VWA domain-containing protein [Pseudomonadota bacterium]